MSSLHPDRDPDGDPPFAGTDGSGDGLAGAPEPAAEDRLLAAYGRLLWLETVRLASRSVRHDLANVFTGISFYSSELVAELPDGTPGATNAAAIANEVATGIRMLDRMLVLWRDPPDAEVLALDPAAVVDALVPLLTLVAPPSELIVGQLDSIVVRASRQGLEEALLALVLDARAAGGPIRISVEAVPSDHAVAVQLDGTPAGRSAAIRVAHDAGSTPPRHGAIGTPPGSPPAARDATLGLALAGAAARAGGGTVSDEQRDDGRRTTTLLLPEAVSRRRRSLNPDEAPDGG